MNSDRDSQIAFFDWLKESKSIFSLADTLCEVLGISKDSAYRRLRGDTLMSFSEIGKISRWFEISLDSYFGIKSSSVLFQKRQIHDQDSFRQYLESIERNLCLLRKSKNHQIYYVAKDIPLFYHFQFDSLTSFKLFFWLKTVFQEPSLQNQSYDSRLVDPSFLEITRAIWHQYLHIPSLEIWSDETINISLRQIHYFLEIGALDLDAGLEIIEDLSRLLEHLKYQASIGKKRTINSKENAQLNGDFTLFYNEVEIGDNTVLFCMDGERMVFKTYNMLNLLTTSDHSFCQETEGHIKRMSVKSTPISLAAEKERTKFFNSMEHKIMELKNRVLFQVSQST